MRTAFFWQWTYLFYLFPRRSILVSLCSNDQETNYLATKMVRREESIPLPVPHPQGEAPVEVPADLSHRKEGRMWPSWLGPFVYWESRPTEGVFTPSSTSPKSLDIANSCINVDLFTPLFLTLLLTPSLHTACCT